MAESRAERKARRALIEAAEGSEEKNLLRNPSHLRMRRVSRPKARLRPSVLALVTAGIKRLTFVPRTHARIRLSLRERSWIPSRLVPSCGLVVGARRSIVLIRSSSPPSRLLWRSFLPLFVSARASPSTPFAVWVLPWATRASILRRVAFVIKLPLRLHPVRRALSAAAF